MPDPVERASPLTKAEARRALNLPEDGRYIGCAGLINRIKGVDRLIEAFFAAAAQLRPDDRLLLAGPVEASIRPLVFQSSDQISAKRLVVLDRSLSGTEIATAIAAMDVVATPYPRHLHSSSIVIRAAAGSRPVLGNDIGWMKRTIAEFQLGATCDVNDRVAFSRAIVKTLGDSADFARTQSARRFVKFHSAENFARHWTQRLRERLGMSPDKDLFPWDDRAGPFEAPPHLIVELAQRLNSHD